MRDENPAYPRRAGRWGRVGAAFLLFTMCSPGRAQSSTETPEILIVGRADVLVAGQVSSSDTASLLNGVDSAQAGGVSGLPMIHGLGDDRIRILVDGVPVAAAPYPPGFAGSTFRPLPAAGRSFDTGFSVKF
jgi:hypothetical protein